LNVSLNIKCPTFLSGKPWLCSSIAKDTIPYPEEFENACIDKYSTNMLKKCRNSHYFVNKIFSDQNVQEPCHKEGINPNFGPNKRTNT